MSVRAYKVIKIDSANTPTFNVWHNQWIMSNVSSNGLSDDGTGLLWFNQDDIQQSLDDLKITDWELYSADNDETKDETIQILENMLKDCNAGDDGVSYLCF